MLFRHLYRLYSNDNNGNRTTCSMTISAENPNLYAQQIHRITLSTNQVKKKFNVTLYHPVPADRHSSVGKRVRVVMYISLFSNWKDLTRNH